jgi:hypothetical protein
MGPKGMMVDETTTRVEWRNTQRPPDDHAFILEVQLPWPPYPLITSMAPQCSWPHALFHAKNCINHKVVIIEETDNKDLNLRKQECVHEKQK